MPMSCHAHAFFQADLAVTARPDRAVPTPPLPHLPAAKCYSCLRMFCSTKYGPQPPVMSCALTEMLTIGGMHEGAIRLWRTDDTFAATFSGARWLPLAQADHAAGYVGCLAWLWSLQVLHSIGCSCCAPT